MKETDREQTLLDDISSLSPGDLNRLKMLLNPDAEAFGVSLSSNSKFLKDDEVLGSGSIIRWSDSKMIPCKGRRYRCVGVICYKCGELRYLRLGNLKLQIKNPNFTGLCRSCQVVKTACTFCGLDIKVYLSRFGYHNHHFCNRMCFDKWVAANDIRRRPLKLSEAGRRAISESTSRTNVRRRTENCNSSSTYPEILLMMIIDKYRLPYKYVGDGSFWIENINPDFVNTNNEKIIIEVFGDYWHNRPEEIKKDSEKGKLLEEYGWKRIILWERDLNESSFEDVVGFIKKSEGICEASGV